MLFGHKDSCSLKIYLFDNVYMFTLDLELLSPALVKVVSGLFVRKKRSMGASPIWEYGT